GEEDEHMPSDSFRGGCLCGATRYEARGKPVVVAFCHCSMCRRSAGAPVTAWAMFDAKSFSWEKGEPQVYASSPGVERRFCRGCGTPLTYTAEFLPGLVDVTVGSLDDPEALPPQMHIWDSRRIGWVRLADELPRHPELPAQP
ncbi:MAG: GFA family protein, partial [Candidatus Binatia bacterium]